MRKLLYFCLMYYSVVLAQPKAQYAHRIEVSVSPQLELLCVLHQLAGVVPIFPSDYASKMELRFARYKDHEAVLHLKKLILTQKYPKEQSDLIHFGRYFSDFPNPRFQLPLHPSDSLLLQKFSKKELEKWWKSCELFAIESSFQVFFEENKDFYDKHCQDLTQLLLSDLYTLPQVEYFFRDKTRIKRKFWLCPLLGSIWGRTLLPSQQGQLPEIMLSYRFLENETPISERKAQLSHTLCHELCHTYISDLTYNLYPKEILKLPHFTKGNSPSAWLNRCDESMIYATTLYIETIYLEQKRMSDYGIELKEARKKGFLYTASTLELLKEYDQYPKKYPNFATYFPFILKKWKEKP